jgi:hypothetical protein
VEGRRYGLLVGFAFVTSAHGDVMLLLQAGVLAIGQVQRDRTDTGVQPSLEPLSCSEIAQRTGSLGKLLHFELVGEAVLTQDFFGIEINEADAPLLKEPLEAHVDTGHRSGPPFGVGLLLYFVAGARISNACREQGRILRIVKADVHRRPSPLVNGSERFLARSGADAAAVDHLHGFLSGLQKQPRADSCLTIWRDEVDADNTVAVHDVDHHVDRRGPEIRYALRTVSEAFVFWLVREWCFAQSAARSMADRYPYVSARNESPAIHRRFSVGEDTAKIETAQTMVQTNHKGLWFIGIRSDITWKLGP